LPKLPKNFVRLGGEGDFDDLSFAILAILAVLAILAIQMKGKADDYCGS
jgi:hypothetical protein